MRKILLIACALAVVVVAGCGGGGGSTPAVTPTADLTLPAGVTASNPNATVTYQSAAQLPSVPAGDAFVAGAVCSPAGTTFTGTGAVLTFHLTTPLASNAAVTLAYFQNGIWSNERAHGVDISVSEDRMTITVKLTEFAYSDYAIFKS